MQYLKGLDDSKVAVYENSLNRVREDYFNFKNDIDERNDEIRKIVNQSFNTEEQRMVETQIVVESYMQLFKKYKKLVDDFGDDFEQITGDQIGSYIEYADQFSVVSEIKWCQQSWGILKFIINI